MLLIIEIANVIMWEASILRVIIRIIERVVYQSRNCEHVLNFTIVVTVLMSFAAGLLRDVSCGFILLNPVLGLRLQLVYMLMC